MRTSNLVRFFALSGLLIVAASLIAYGSIHKPFKAEELLSILIAMYRAGVALGIILLAGGIGKKIRRSDEGSLFQAAGDAAVGLGVIGLAVFLIGTTIGLNLWILIAVFAAGAALLRREILSFAGAWQEAAAYFKGLDMGFGLVAGFAIFTLAANFVTALAPPTSFDGLTYHLTLPRYYLLESRIGYIPEVMYWGMPQLTEMAFTFAMRLGGAQTAAVLEWMIGVVALAAIFSFVRKMLNNNSAWVAIASLLCGWTISDSLSRAYIEWSILLYGAVFLIQLNQWRASHSRTDLIWSAIFAGLALSTKYTGGVLVIAGIAVLLFDLRRSFFKGAFLFGLVATTVFSPWLVKNFLATGNPFYPILFPAGAMTATRLDFYEGTPVPLSIVERMLLPVLASFLGVEGGAPYNASIGPLLAGLSIPAWVALKYLDAIKKQALVTSSIVLAIGFGLWMIGSAQTRLLIQPRLFLVFFPAWAAVAAYGFHGLEQSNPPALKVSWLVSMLVAFSLGLNAYETGMTLLRNDALKFAAGQISESQYLAQNMGSYYSAMESIRSLPRGSKVLMLWETRGYYCIPACNPDETIDEFKNAITLYKSRDEILTAWHNEGYTHVLIHNLGADFVKNNDLLRYIPAEWEKFDELKASLLKVENFGAAYNLYQLP